MESRSRTEEELRRALSAGREAGRRHCLRLPAESLRGPAGARLGAHAGASLDFHDYRDYQPGDDLRNLDWNVYARSDREVVKLHREEIAPRLDVFLDVSSSMAIADDSDGGPFGKAASSLMLAAACCVAAEAAQCSHAVWPLRDDLSPLRGSSGAVEDWAIPAFDADEPPSALFRRAAARWRRNGVRMLVSDLMWREDPSLALSVLADGAASLLVVQLLAPEEAAPTFGGQYKLTDSETGDELDVFVDDMTRAAYLAALGRHRTQWQTACRRFGAQFVSLTTDTLLEGGRLAALERCGFLEAQ